MPRFIELSHPIYDGMPAYPGLPAARVEAILTHEQSRPRYQGRAEFFLGRVELSGNTGTYLDAPFHRYPEGEDLATLPLERVAALPGVVLDGRGERAVDADCGDDDLGGRAVLIRTGWDTHWGTARYWEPGPYLSARLLDQLLGARPLLVGVDFSNVDDTADLARPAHTRLLAAGIPIVEHMTNLAALPRDGFRFYAVPLKLVRGASFPVRAFAEWIQE